MRETLRRKRIGACPENLGFFLGGGWVGGGWVWGGGGLGGGGLRERGEGVDGALGWGKIGMV